MIGNPLLLALTSLALFTWMAPAAEKKVVCFVGHKTSHGFGAHEYQAGNHLMAAWLEKAYPGQIEARFSVGWPGNAEEFFAGASTVVFFCSGGGGHLVNGHVESFDKVMRTGAGLACLHYAVEVPIGPSTKGMLNWMGGYFEAHWSVNPHWVAKFEVFPGHEAARGIHPFQIDDEWYFHMRFRGGMEGVTPILSAVAPQETMKRPDGAHSGNREVRRAVEAGEPQHVAWAYQRGEDYGQGRGFGFTGLHYHWNWEDDNFRKTVLNGVAWTAKLPIPENGVESPRPTREELESNILEHAGEQNRKPKEAAPAPKGAALDPQADLRPLFASEVVTSKTPGHAVSIDVELPAGSKELHLLVMDGGNGFSCDWADWGEPRFVLASGGETRLTDLDWKSASSGWGQVRKNANAGGGKLIIAGNDISHGIGTHANSHIVFDVPVGATRFRALAGLDKGGTSQQGGNATSVQFLVFNARPAFLAARGAPPAYVKQSSGTSRQASEALDTLTVHPELEVQLFASEPMMLSPSAIDVDHRGRVWVCEVVNYRRRKGERPEGDRILILEDKDGDGKADEVRVFYQGTDVDSAHGICVLGERVIISAGDDIFSLYDRDGDGKADPGSKELLFTKIGGAQHDHGIHAVHFGPDGRLYFNFGNTGTALHDAKGRLVIDQAGREVRGGNLPYQEGMVFRCEPDGSKVETLGWNFRNNWEAAVDSYGTIWQSDNDDDGNQAVRINFVMEFGNYGFKDEITRAGWRDARPNLEPEIPRRHWHLNDPGVVPNLLITGAGSPTGICVYEGSLLPAVFHGQPIHCDAGPNVVRAYITGPKGAGYKADSLNILENTTDRWFRPSDVTVAPDGSLMVADWYDPGVGGHGMGDVEKGRLFRVTAKGRSKFEVPSFKFDSIEGAIEALKSPNQEARYLAWRALRAQESKALPALTKLFDSGLPHERARALWLIARLGPGMVERALGDQDPNIRITALRATRQHYPGQVLGAVGKLVGDPDARVRRECAIALRFDGGEEASRLWAQLAARHESGDRWSLEALGIGADLHWDARMGAAQELPQEMVWRSRGSQSAGLIAQAILSGEDVDAAWLRALHFQPAGPRQEAYVTLFEKGPAEAALYAAGQLGPAAIAKIEGGDGRLDSLLDPVRGKAEFVRLAARLSLRGFEAELADFIAAHPEAEESVTAALLLMGDRNFLTRALRDEPRAASIAHAMGKSGDRAAVSVLSGELTRKETGGALARILVSALAYSGTGGRELIKLASEGKLADDLHFLAAGALARHPDAKLRQEAEGSFKVPAAVGAEKLPPVAGLMAMKGDAAAGKAYYTQTACITCHKVKGEGIDFGPDLTEIGGKLSREALFEAILFPNAAISHGFHGVSMKMKDGGQFTGYVTGETDEEVTLRLPGGVSQVFRRDSIASREDMKVSLMPPGLTVALEAQQLVDLVAYLQSLKL